MSLTTVIAEPAGIDSYCSIVWNWWALYFMKMLLWKEKFKQDVNCIITGNIWMFVIEKFNGSHNNNFYHCLLITQEIV